MPSIAAAGTSTLGHRKVRRMGYGAMQLAGPGVFGPPKNALGATPMQVALAWLLQRAPNLLLIPGTASLAHLRENLAAAELALPPDALVALDRINPAPG